MAKKRKPPSKKLPSYEIDGVLSGKAFDDALAECVKATRVFIYNDNKLVVVDKQKDKTIIKLFGNKEQFIVDHKQKRVYRGLDGSEHVIPDEIHNPISPRSSGSIHTSVKEAGLFLQPHELYTSPFNLIQNELERRMKEHNFIPHKEHNTFVRTLKLSQPSKAQEVWDELHRQGVMLNRYVVTIQNTCWGKNVRWHAAVRIIGKIIWDYLDREIAGIAIRLNGRKSTLSDYNLVWNNIDEVRKVMQHAPGLLPIWAKVITDRRDLNRPNVIEDCKRAMESNPENPLTRRAWKYLIRLKPMWIQYLMLQEYPAIAPLLPPATVVQQQVVLADDDWDEMGNHNTPFPSDSNRIQTLNSILDFYAEVGETPKFTTFIRMARTIKGRKRCPALLAFVRAAFRESLKQPAKKFMTDQVELAWDWYKSYGIEQEAGRVAIGAELRRARRDDVDPVLDRNQMNSPWAWFMRQQKEWHERVIANEKLAIVNTQWSSLIEQFEEDGYTIVPLITAHELHEEGKIMHHCVSSYSRACEEGRSRIFSIRKGDERQATFEIARHSANDSVFTIGGIYDGTDNSHKVWKVVQNRGHCNAAVSPELTKLGQLTCRKYQEADDKERAEKTEAQQLSMAG